VLWVRAADRDIVESVMDGSYDESLSEFRMEVKEGDLNSLKTIAAVS
jgi:hypothetical protein